ncbi:hypothetical protein [Kordia sp.]|uniref:hypothetical protein n=1 Tax=Kordia sp. TaxID=1965332 RepID=UPI003B5AE79C
MKLALVHTDHNPHPRCGIFIKHASPKVWLTEIMRMQLKLSDCTVYVCPGLEANSISGIVLILNEAYKNLDIGKNIAIQKAHKGFYLPENTMLNMALSAEEYEKILNGTPHFFHHEFGLMELEEELQWETLLQASQERFPAITEPAKGVNIPARVTAFSVEIEEKEETEGLANPFGDADIDPQDLPFNMKKVLQGNNREVEKYLRYLEKNPEAALKMAIPLDMMGTSRGKAYAEFKFKSNFFESIGLGNVSESAKSSMKTIVGVIAIIAVFWIGYLVIDHLKKDQIEVVSDELIIASEDDTEKEPLSEDLVIATDDTESNNDAYVNNTNKQAIDTARSTSSGNIIQTILWTFLVIVIALLIIYYIQHINRNKPKPVKSKNPSWLDLPEDSEMFSFDDEEKVNDGGFYFGGNELSTQSKMVIFLVIIGLLIYLFYPMLTTSELGILFAVFTGAIVIRLLYLLIRKNKTIIDE